MTNNKPNPAVDALFERGWIIPSARSMSGVANTFARVYSPRFDEAIRHYAENARSMRNDTFLTALMLERTRPLLNWKWEIILDDDNPREAKTDPAAEEIRQMLASIVGRTHRFHEMREYLTDYLWYGRYGSQILYGDENVGGYRHRVIVAHEPVDGDNILPTFDGYPALAINSSDQSYYVGRYGRESVTTGDRFAVLKLGRPDLRQRFVIQRHHVRAGDFFWPETGGRVGGYGLRHQVYWTWYLRQQVLESMTNFMDKVGTLGLLIFYYEEGNDESKEKAETAAIEAGQRNALAVGVPKGKDPKTGGVDLIPANMTGVQFLVEFAERYFERHIERLFVGQSASASSEGDSLGGNSSDFQKDTKYQLLRSDAGSTACGFTEDLVRPLQRENFPGVPWRYSMRFVLPDPDAAKKLDATAKAFQIGVTFDGDEVRQLTEMSKPGQGAFVLQQNQQPAQGAPGMPGGQQQPPASGEQQPGPQPGFAAQPKTPLPSNGAAEPQNQPVPGMGELVAAMVQAASAGDHDAVDRLAELGGDPGALAGFMGDDGEAENNGDDVPDQLATVLQSHPDSDMYEACLLAALADGNPIQQAMAIAAQASMQGQQASGQPVNYQFREEDHPRADDGKFGSGGGGKSNAGSGAAEPQKSASTNEAPDANNPNRPGVFGRIRSYGNAVADTKIGRTVQALEHKLAIAAHKTREVAESAAQKRGLPPEKADRLKKWLAALDFAGAWVAGGVATAVAGPLAGKAVSLTMPTASALYLAYSTARDPMATWSAAVDAVKKTSLSPVAAAGDVRAAWRGETVNHASFADVVNYAWDEPKHPRDDSGRFAHKGDIEAAKSDPAKASELRGRVIDPFQREILDAAIGDNTPEMQADRLEKISGHDRFNYKHPKAAQKLNDTRRAHEKQRTHETAVAYVQAEREHMQALVEEYSTVETRVAAKQAGRAMGAAVQKRAKRYEKITALTDQYEQLSEPDHPGYPDEPETPSKPEPVGLEPTRDGYETDEDYQSELEEYRKETAAYAQDFAEYQADFAKYKEDRAQWRRQVGKIDQQHERAVQRVEDKTARLQEKIEEMISDAESDFEDALSDAYDSFDAVLQEQVGAEVERLRGESEPTQYVSFAGVLDYQWTAGKTKGGDVKAVWSGDGQRAPLYGERARRALASQGKQDRGEPLPQTPQRRAIELKQQREPGRQEARQSWRKAIENPGSVRPEELAGLADQLKRLTRDELRAQARELSQRAGGLKTDLVNRLLAYAGSQGAGQATPAKNLPARPSSAAQPQNPPTQTKPKAKAFRPPSDTFAQYVLKQHGGINPNDHALKTVFSNMAEAIEQGIPIAVFRKSQTTGLDSIAESMARDGLMSVPENRHAHEYLLELMAKGVDAQFHDSTYKYEQALNEHYRTLQEAADDPTIQQSEIAEALRISEANARREVTDAILAEYGLQPEDGGFSGSTDFEFGANADDADDAAEQPVEAAPTESGPVDLFGRPLPKTAPKSKQGQQLTMDDSVRELWHQKAEEFASNKGFEIGRRGFAGQFEAGGKWYQVGKAEDGYPINEISAPKLTGDK
jgi:hypothetical protein